MRTAYGQLMCLLQDSTREEVTQNLGFGLVRPVVTVHAFLEHHNALHILHDAKLYVCSSGRRVVSSPLISCLLSNSCRFHAQRIGNT
jgi:hypothetical protein